MQFKRIFFIKDGQSERQEWPACSLSEFNRRYDDWVARYYEGCEQTECENWDDALEVLNTVGVSTSAARFEIEDF